MENEEKKNICRECVCFNFKVGNRYAENTICERSGATVFGTDPVCDSFKEFEERKKEEKPPTKKRYIVFETDVNVNDDTEIAIYINGNKQAICTRSKAVPEYRKNVLSLNRHTWQKICTSGKTYISTKAIYVIIRMARAKLIKEWFE
jgi:hypothetical protein